MEDAQNQYNIASIIIGIIIIIVIIIIIINAQRLTIIGSLNRAQSSVTITIKVLDPLYGFSQENKRICSPDHSQTVSLYAHCTKQLNNTKLHKSLRDLYICKWI